MATSSVTVYAVNKVLAVCFAVAALRPCAPDTTENAASWATKEALRSQRQLQEATVRVQFQTVLFPVSAPMQCLIVLSRAARELTTKEAGNLAKRCINGGRPAFSYQSAGLNFR